MTATQTFRRPGGSRPAPCLRTISLVAILLGLAGCATVGTASRDWHFVPDGRQKSAKLAYGAAETDDIDLMLWCDLARHQVRFTPGDLEDAPFKRLTLESGGQSLSLDLRQNEKEGSEGAASLANPVLAAFRSSGRLRMRLDAQAPHDLDAHSGEGRRQVGAFFAACR